MSEQPDNEEERYNCYNQQEDSNKSGVSSNRLTTASETTLEESIEVLDVTGMAWGSGSNGNSRSSFDSTLDRVFGDITKQSAGKQVLIGGGAGWVTGYLGVKVGKAAALTLGATALAFQLAQYNGLIKVEWTKVNRIMAQAQSQATDFIQGNKGKRKDFVEGVKNFYHENFFLAVGFSSGFLVGVFF